MIDVYIFGEMNSSVSERVRYLEAWDGEDLKLR